MTKASPLKIPSVRRMIIESRRRGIPIRRVADQIGVSYQAVSAFLIRQNLPAVENANARRGAIYSPTAPEAVCKMCARRVQVTDWGQLYCSRKCYGLSQRLFDDRVIERMIAARLSPMTWAGLARMFGTDTQVIQDNIWHYLAREGRLTKSHVHHIWHASVWRVPPSWKWLVNETGLEPSE